MIPCMEFELIDRADLGLSVVFDHQTDEHDSRRSSHFLIESM